MTIMEVGYVKVSDRAFAPTFMTDGAAGADLRCSEDVTVESGQTVLLPTGLAVMIPDGYVGLLFARSGMAYRTPLRLANAVGVIDSDYRGEVKVMMENPSRKPVAVSRGDRVAQIVVVPHVTCDWTEAEGLTKTARGIGGFGSTGRR